jgi:hypothetical protein
MSLLGIDFDIRGYIVKPFYLCLGAFYFIVLLSLLGALYITLYMRNTLEEALKERNMYKIR